MKEISIRDYLLKGIKKGETIVFTEEKLSELTPDELTKLKKKMQAEHGLQN